MPLWKIARHDPVTRQETHLGQVRAKSQPQAVLKGLRKFGITTNEEQRTVSARPAARQKPKPPLPPEEQAELRRISKAFNGLLRGREK